jgi:hypothetical protein
MTSFRAICGHFGGFTPAGRDAKSRPLLRMPLFIRIKGLGRLPVRLFTGSSTFSVQRLAP